MFYCPTVAEIWQVVTEWAPSELAEEWDNPGIQVGNPDSRVKRLVTALDVSSDLIEFAVSAEAEMVLTHHPLIFSPLKNLVLSTPVPQIVSLCIKNDIAVASAHTNLDSAENGVSDQLASMLGLEQLRPLVPSSSYDMEPGRGSITGIGRVGTLSRPVSLGNIIDTVCKKLDIPGVTMVGDPAVIVETVAVCGGSGSSLWPAFLESGADLFITAEIKHSVAREAEMLGLAVMDAGHFATEWPVVPVLAHYMKGIAVRRQWDMEVLVFSDERAPAIWRVPGHE